LSKSIKKRKIIEIRIWQNSLETTANRYSGKNSKQTYKLQNSYCENKLILKKQKVKLQKRLVNATEKCDSS